MSFEEDEFLKTSSLINNNQAEYTILSALKEDCNCEIFLFQIFDIQLIKETYSEVLNYLKAEYRASELNLFCIDTKKNFHKKKLGNLSSETDNEDFLFNIALDISLKNNSYVLVKSKTVFSLLYNGRFDENFKNYYISRETMLQIEAEKYGIEDLKLVFESYHSNRKYNGASYIKLDISEMPKVIDSVSEQELRNDLFSFLRNKTKLIKIPESCTSLMRDEESVDISLIDSDNNAAIIEVKFVIGKGFFLSDPKKEKYRFDRFKEGYKQLTRYCKHLFDEKLYNVRYAYLYMFYAHASSEEIIKNIASTYYDDFIKNNKNEEVEIFKQQFSGTIFDNIIDIEK